MSVPRNPRWTINLSTYSRIILILYGVGVLGIVTIIASVVSFAFDSLYKSLTVLVIGVVCLSLMALSIDTLERKCGFIEDTISQARHNDSTTTSGTQNVGYTPEGAEVTPPRYSDLMEKELSPPSYEEIQTHSQQNFGKEAIQEP